MWEWSKAKHMTINDIIKGLNEHKMFKDKNKNFLAIKDDAGKTRFLNRTAVVLADGSKLQEVGKNGVMQDAFVWTLGAEMTAREEAPMPTEEFQVNN